MSSCDRHRDYLSALADGELSLVPAETVAHARSCSECGREVETQRCLSPMLAAAGRLQEPARRRPRPRGRWAAAIVSAAVLVTAVAGTVGWRASQGPDQLAAAVSVAGQPMQLQSTNGSEIEAWCEREAERPIPDISGASLEPAGARMDRREADEIVTVTYVTGRDRTIRVSWLDARLISPGARSVQARSISGTTVLVVASGAGTAIVSGDAPPASLWGAAARIQAVTLDGAEDPVALHSTGKTGRHIVMS
jgi:hypothetical protein